LAEDFRLLRVSIEKHEIAKDRNLTAPLQMQKIPVQGNASDLYEYSKKDPRRGHIMPRGISSRGSLMWQVIDVQKKAVDERWIERRALSDRLINLWGAAPTRPAA
jgi:hypothetical protein